MAAKLHHKRGNFCGAPPGIRTQNIRFLKPTRLPIAAGALEAGAHGEVRTLTSVKTLVSETSLYAKIPAHAR